MANLSFSSTDLVVVPLTGSSAQLIETQVNIAIAVAIPIRIFKQKNIK
jgi:hypothetical protein